MLNPPTTIAECAALSLRIRNLQNSSEYAAAEEELAALTHALLDLASKPCEPTPGTEKARLWAKFDKEHPRPYQPS
jgi:hypothetical protein